MPRRLSGAVPRRTTPWPATAILITLTLLAAGCGSGIEAVSFDPGVPCTSTEHEGRFAGAYPELERLLPATYEARPPSFVDSGRHCTAEQLGTLAEAGITEIHFAGSNWDLGGGKALTVAAFEAPGLDPVTMIDFYEAGARASNRTNDLRRIDDLEVGDRPASRLDVLFGQTRQTIVAWPADASGEPGRVLVLLAADLGDTNVADVLERLASGTF